MSIENIRCSRPTLLVSFNRRTATSIWGGSLRQGSYFGEFRHLQFSVCVYVCMYVCMHVWNTCIHVCMYEYMYAHRQTYVQTYIHTNIHVYMYTCMHVCMIRWNTITYHI